MMILHSGFKGTLLNISAAALERFGCGRIGGKIWAWIGPRIGACCYSRRTDDPVTREALAKFSPECAKDKDGFVFFDIGGEIRRQLSARGVPDDNIFDFGGLHALRKRNILFVSRGRRRKKEFFTCGTLHKPRKYVKIII